MTEPKLGPLGMGSAEGIKNQAGIYKTIDNDQTEPMLQFFEYSHLPEHLQKVSAQFCNVAHWIVADLPRNPARTTALLKLLESKDAAVRAVLYK
jgi:hypothetical protein